jgi:hypothetical protein
MVISNISYPVVISTVSFCCFIIPIRCTVEQIVNVSGHCVEVWYISLAVVDQDCIKVSVEWAISYKF